MFLLHQVMLDCYLSAQNSILQVAKLPMPLDAELGFQIKLPIFCKIIFQKGEECGWACQIKPCIFMLSLLHCTFSLNNAIIYKICFLLITTRILALLPSLLHLYDLLKIALLTLITYCLVDNLISAQVMHLNCKNPRSQLSRTKFNSTCKLFTCRQSSSSECLINTRHQLTSYLLPQCRGIR